MDAGHGAYELPHLLELCFERIQVLVEIWAVLVHARGSRGSRRQSVISRCSSSPPRLLVLHPLTPFGMFCLTCLTRD